MRVAAESHLDQPAAVRRTDLDPIAAIGRGPVESDLTAVAGHIRCSTDQRKCPGVVRRSLRWWRRRRGRRPRDRWGRMSWRRRSRHALRWSRCRARCTLSRCRGGRPSLCDAMFNPGLRHPFALQHGHLSGHHVDSCIDDGGGARVELVFGFPDTGGVTSGASALSAVER